MLVKKWVKEINILDNGDIKIRVKLPLNKTKVKLSKVSDKVDTPVLNPILAPNLHYIRQDSRLRLLEQELWLAYYC